MTLVFLEDALLMNLDSATQGTPLPFPGCPGWLVTCKYLEEETKLRFTGSLLPPFPQFYQLGSKGKFLGDGSLRKERDVLMSQHRGRAHHWST